LAALKRCGEEDWKKRALPPTTASSSLNDDEISSKPVNIIKLQQEQIKQQLQNITPKPAGKSVNTSDMSQRANQILAGQANNTNNGSTVTSIKRNVLTPVNSNTANIETVATANSNNGRFFESNESLESIDLDKQQQRAPTGKRNTFINPSDASNNGAFSTRLLFKISE
jgi:hypothetical protein